MIEPRMHLQHLHRDTEFGANRAKYVCLDRNERVIPLPASILQEILSSLPPYVFNAYPDSSPLYKRLSRHLNVGLDQIVVTSGSDAAIRRVFDTFVDPGDFVLQVEPSYAMYQVYTKLYQGCAEVVHYTSSLELPIDDLIARIVQRPRLLLLANPDQPTGTAQTTVTMQTLAREALRNDVVMLIDEAYHPFNVESAVSWSAGFENVLVSRTFSKASGLAGLRVGYLVGASRLIDWIQRTRGSFDVNTVGIAVASWLLDHPQLEYDHVREVEAGRDILRTAAARLGLGFPQCRTNFQLLRFPLEIDLRCIVNELKEEGFLVKGPFDAQSMRGCLRVSLAGPEVIQSFVCALDRVISRVRVK
jgi:histidinol-phosphate aminotransferase